MAANDLLLIQENSSGQLEKRVLGAATNGKVILIDLSSEPPLHQPQSGPRPRRASLRRICKYIFRSQLARLG